jgi:hypothetical protein
VPLTDDQIALVRHYWPLLQSEWKRIGISEDDQSWIFAGGGTIDEQGLEAALASFRSLPTGMGAEAYCERFGIDYANGKRQNEIIRSGGDMSAL